MRRGIDELNQHVPEESESRSLQREIADDAHEVEREFERPSLSASPRLLVTVASVVLAGIAGTLITTQARINGQLSLELGDGYTAALISFFVGLVVIAVVTVASPRARRGIRAIPAAVRRRELPWWSLLGGFAGGLFVLSQGLAVTLIGIALFTVATVAGQTVSSLVIDAHGMGKVPPKPITATRVVGTVVVIASVAVSVSPQVNAHAPFLVLLMPLIAGCLTGWQQAVNGQVRTTIGSPVSATLVNFIGGTLLLGIVALVHVAVAGPPAPLPGNPLLYIGGVLGVIFIMGSAIVVPIVGVLLQGLAAVCGQLIASLVIEALFPAPGTSLQLVTVLGTLLTIAGLVISVIPRRRRPIGRATPQQ